MTIPTCRSRMLKVENVASFSAGFMSDQLFIADVRDGLGPFLGIFLTQRHWQAEDIGLLMSVGGIAWPAGDPARRLHHRQLAA